jgi:16S rRNA (guanine527-N7)-methyltransferase
MDAAGGGLVSPTPDVAAELFGPTLETAEQYAAILATRGVEWGLIGPREAERLWERHVLNSLAVSGFVPHGASVVDVGSGAGLPGIPLALGRPDVRVTLLEPLERRAHFLTLAVDELGLGEQVRVIRDRAETHKALYDVVTCRAVSALPKLLTWTMHLFYPDGRLVALKGASASDEVQAADRDLRRRRLSGRVASVQVYPGAEPTYVVVVQ